MHAKADSVAETLAAAQETRRQWAALTEPTRRMALAADLELRRRHPEAKLPPLTAAEPGPDRQATVPDGGMGAAGHHRRRADDAGHGRT